MIVENLREHQGRAKDRDGERQPDRRQQQLCVQLLLSIVYFLLAHFGLNDDITPH